MTRLWFIALSALLVGPRPAAAQDVAAGQVPAIAQLVVNGLAQGEAWLILRGNDILVPKATLEAAGLRWTRALEMPTAERLYVSLQSMVPAIRFQLDAAAAELTLVAPADMFTARAQLGIDGAPVPLRPRPASVYLNYGSTMARGRPTIWALETGVRLMGGVWHASVVRTGTRGTTRGPLTFTRDDEHRLVRWQMGDVAADSGFSGVGRPMIGLSVASEFSLNPQFTTFAPISLSGGTTTAAVADLYVNGQLVSRTAVEPGAFDLGNVPAPVGAGDVRVVLRDQFGRVQEFTRDYYRSPGLLRPGLRVFRYAVGAARQSSEGLAWQYGALVGSGEDRIGITESLTAGASGAFAPGVFVGGPDVAVRLPLGEAEINVRASYSDGRPGTAGMITYLYRGRRISAQAAARWTSASFREAEPRSLTPTPRLMTTAAIDVAVGRGVSAGLRYRSSEYGGVVSFPLPGRLAASATWSRGVGAIHPWTALAVITVPIDRRTSGNVTHQVSSGRAPVSQTSVQRSLELAPGVGYEVQLQRSAAMSTANVAVQYQNEQIRVEARRDMAGSVGVNSLNLAGAIVGVDGAWRLSRPVTDAFALVRVNGVGHVRTYLSNQYVGRTDRHGDLVVPSLTSYVSNHIAIDDRDLPFYSSVPQTDALVAPALQGGAVIRFAVPPAPSLSFRGSTASTVRAVGQFRLDLPPDARGNAEAMVRWSDGEERVPVRADGSFEFDRATIGTHRVELTAGHAAFVCTLVVGSRGIRADGSEVVGMVPCSAAPARSAGGGR